VVIQRPIWSFILGYYLCGYRTAQRWKNKDVQSKEALQNSRHVHQLTGHKADQSCRANPTMHCLRYLEGRQKEETIHTHLQIYKVIYNTNYCKYT